MLAVRGTVSVHRSELPVWAGVWVSHSDHQLRGRGGRHVTHGALCGLHVKPPPQPAADEKCTFAVPTPGPLNQEGRSRAQESGLLPNFPGDSGHHLGVSHSFLFLLTPSGMGGKGTGDQKGGQACGPAAGVRGTETDGATGSCSRCLASAVSVDPFWEYLPGPLGREEPTTFPGSGGITAS